MRNLLAWALLILAGYAGADDGVWQPVPGNAISLSASAAGEVYAVGKGGNVWRWDKEMGLWGHFAGKLKRIAAGPTGSLWGIAPDGMVRKHNGLVWEDQRFKALDLALTPSGDLVLVLENGDIRKRPNGGAGEEPLPGKAARIASARDGVLWKLDADRGIARLSGNGWQPLPGKARDLTANPDGGIYIATDEGALMRWDESGQNWQPVSAPQDVAMAAASAERTLWVARSNGAIYAQGTIMAPKKERVAAEVADNGSISFRRGQRGHGSRYGSGRSGRYRAATAAALKPESAITDPNPIEFVDTLGTASRIAIGMDGSVFTLGIDGLFYRWNNTEHRFLPFPGNLAKISVDPSGNPWGVNALGRIFRHDGADWRQVRGSASDIAIGANGAVIIADANGVLGKFDAATNGFLRIDGNAILLAVAPDGMPWGLLADDTVVRCSTVPCDRFPHKARAISIGPDGSVYAVTPEGKLERYDDAASTWKQILVPNYTIASVAVGPRGKPWVITTTGEVLASAFFERDESTDRQTAAATISPTTGSGDIATVVSATSGFSFTKTIQFSSLTVGLAVLNKISVGPDGIALAMGDNGHRMQRYNTTTKVFENVANLPPGMMTDLTTSYQNAITGPDGTLWILSGDTDGLIYHQKTATTFEQFRLPIASPVPNFMQPGTPVMNHDIATGPDGAVYAIDTGNAGAGTLYRKLASETKFTKFISGSYKHVTVTRAGDVWLIDNNDFLRQVVGTKAELRPANKQTLVFNIAGGADGSLYAVIPDTVAGSVLAKWNATNQAFDKVKISNGIPNFTSNGLGVGLDGRPWVIDTSRSGNAFVAK